VTCDPAGGTAGAHEPEVIEGSAYRTGHGNCTGTSANLRNARHFPVVAVCGACSQVLYRASIDGGWMHTGRLAGQASPSPR
jgi:hypothetical protein